jgi:CheY-like chemotaxis protein
MTVLLVEDEEPKRESLLGFLTREFPNLEVSFAKSVRAAIAQVRAVHPSLLLLDMSLPTFDIAPGEPGGRPQGFGGTEVIRFLDSEDLQIPTIVVTAYEAFPKKNGQRIGYESLREELSRDFGGFFRGLVYFDSIQGQWSDELKKLVALVINEPKS